MQKYPCGGGWRSLGPVSPLQVEATSLFFIPFCLAIPNPVLIAYSKLTFFSWLFYNVLSTQKANKSSISSCQFCNWQVKSLLQPHPSRISLSICASVSAWKAASCKTIPVPAVPLPPAALLQNDSQGDE